MTQDLQGRGRVNVTALLAAIGYIFAIAGIIFAFVILLS